MENEPLINEEIAQTSPALQSSSEQGSEPVEILNPFASQSPQKSKKTVVVLAVILIAVIIGAIVYLILANSESSSVESRENQSQEQKNKTESNSEQKNDQSIKENPETDSDQSASQTSETTSGPCTIAYLGELEGEFADGKLYDCIIPNERVLNAPTSEYPLKFVARPDNNGKFELTTSGEYTGTITKNSNGSFTVTIANLESYNYSANGGKLDNPQASATFAFDQEVVSMGIGGYGQAVGEERAFFATGDGSVYYIGLREIVQGRTELKQFANMANVVAFVRGGLLEAPDGGHYIGGFMPYAVRSDGYVYELKGE